MSTLSLANHPSVPSLKKLWNREYASQRLAAELERSEKENNYQFSIILLELEGLSQSVANRLGYSTKDNIWPQVLSFLTRDLSSEEVCCRLGGDEFLLILPATPGGKASARAENLRKAWGAEVAASATILEMTVAYASSFAHGATIQTLFAAADQALDFEKQRQSSMPTPTPARSISPVFAHSLRQALGNS